MENILDRLSNRAPSSVEVIIQPYRGSDCSFEDDGFIHICRNGQDYCFDEGQQHPQSYLNSRVERYSRLVDSELSREA